MIDVDDIRAAADRIKPYVFPTPLVPAEPMSERTGSTVVIKPEHRQRTGSFKLRGALNKTFSLTGSEAKHGIITASSGNHGIGVATAASLRGIDCTVYLPDGASAAKVATIRRLGATIVTVDDTDTAMAEVEARKASGETGATYISPYNDAQIVAGQGTIGVELSEDLRTAPDAVVVAVGGGGLISGIGTWLARHWPETTVIGASPENDHAMAASVAAGAIMEPPAQATFSDGTAGAVEADSITFDICRAVVDEWVTVTEQDIARAVVAMVDDQHELVEGAAGVALAAAERHAADNPGSTVVVVSCGANVASPALARMLAAAGEGS